MVCVVWQVILLKRFAQTGQHVNKVETLVRFPLRGLDLTRWLEGPVSVRVCAWVCGTWRR